MPTRTANPTGKRSLILRQEFGQLWTRTCGDLKPANGGLRKVGFCATNPGEGTSSVAANYACFLGEQGQRVTIVDTNFRKPSLAESFGVKGTRGLWEVMEGVASVDEVLERQVSPGVNLVPAGKPPVNFLIAQDHFELSSIFQELDSTNDIVILDLPPLSSAPEVNLLLPQLDGIVLVVQANRNRVCAIERSLKTVQFSDCNLLGTVLNKVTYDLPAAFDKLL